MKVYCGYNVQLSLQLVAAAVAETNALCIHHVTLFMMQNYRRCVFSKKHGKSLKNSINNDNNNNNGFV